MSNIEQLEQDIQNLKDIEAIKTLKHKYIRTMTLGLWDELDPLVTDDVTTSYSDGKYTFNGKKEVMDFLISSHSEDSGMVSTWLVGAPEIQLTSATTATGIWAFQHYTIMKTAEANLEMFAYYTDDYIKVDGLWKICKTGYQRIVEQEMSRKDLPSLKLTVG